MHAPAAPLATLVAALATLAMAVVTVDGVSLIPSPSSSSEKSPCSSVGGQGRGGNCALHCALGARLCRVCCLGLALTVPTVPTVPTVATKQPDDGNGGDGQPSTEAQPLDVTFPSKLPEGTEDAMLETAAHILAIVSGEDSQNIRRWVENPERNTANLDDLAGKLSTFPNAPYDRDYWRKVLQASKDRPFTFLREALAVRSAYQQSQGSAGAGGSPGGGR